MNTREKAIVVVTAVVLVIGVGMQLIPEDALSGGLLGADVDSTKVLFDQNMEKLRIGPGIRDRYENVNTKLEERLTGRSPELTFSDEVTRMFTDRGWPTPQIKPYKTAAIKEVKEYFYVDLEVTVNGDYDKIMNLLVDLQENNLIIKEFKLEKPNMDQPNVTLNLTLSRLAKVEAGKPKKRTVRNR